MSNTERLVLNTKKSLYEPVEIEIDGQVYQSVKTTNAVLMEINKLDEKADEEDTFETVCEIVQLLFAVDLEILEKLDKREVQDIYTFAKRRFLEIEKQRLDLITKTFGNIWGPEKQKVKAIVPNGKRSGNKQ